MVNHRVVTTWGKRKREPRQGPSPPCSRPKPFNRDPPPTLDRVVICGQCQSDTLGRSSTIENAKKQYRRRRKPLQPEAHAKSRRRKLWEWLGFSEKGKKTGLDLFQALGAIAIPVVAVVLTAYFASTQDSRQQAAEDIRKKTEVAVEAERAQYELEVEDRRAQNQLQAEESRATNEALQSYLDDMTTLMLREAADPTQIFYIKELKRARTLTILTRLNRDQEENKAKGKRSVLQFVYESGWINIGNPFFDMSGSDLSGAGLRGLNLSGADLRGLDFSDADLSGADLSGSNLQNSRVSQEQLDSTHSLAGAIMPDGSEHD